MPTKPTGPSVPARSLAESEFMLREAKRRSDGWDDFTSSSMAIVGAIILLASVVGMALGWLDILRGIFR